MADKKQIIDFLKDMDIPGIRAVVLTRHYGYGENHEFAQEYLEMKERELRDSKDSQTLREARRANRISILALLFSVLSLVVSTSLVLFT